MNLPSPITSSSRENAPPFRHSVGLITLFLLGNLILSFPKGQGQSSGLFGFLAAFLAGLALAWLFGRTDAVAPGRRTPFLCAALILLCFLGYTDCCSDYLHMVNVLRLPDTPLWIIALFFLGLTVVFASSRPDMASMFSLVSVLFVVVTAVLMCLISVKNMDLSLVKRFLTVRPGDIGRQALTFFVHSVGLLIIPVLYLRYTGTPLLHRPIRGVLLGGAVLLICMAQIMLVLGSGILERVDYPYTTATGAITTTHSFTRTDLFTFYLFFVTSLLKASLCTAVAVRSAKEAFGLSPWWIRIGFALLCFLLLIVPATTGWFATSGFMIVLGLLQTGVTTAYLVTARKHRKKEPAGIS